MGKIKVLSSEMISKIAAGEVIERPAFVVKELIENSIDARADFLKIEIEDSGLKKISLLDNGEGMDEADLKNCFLPHTTSKIYNDDLVGIETLGFRGEALSSITASSDLTIISRPQNAAFGFKIELLAGQVNKFSSTGSAIGTEVMVQNLFANIPARKKFLKTKRTEFNHILEMVCQYALSYLNIRFELFHNKKLIFVLGKNQTLEERIKFLLGGAIYQQIIPLRYEDSYLKIKGFLCKPEISSHTTLRQYLFINGRRVSDNLISAAVKEAYGNLLEKAQYPIFILFLDLPAQAVDVNVHPRKEQVSFYDNQFIYDGVLKATAKTLEAHNLTFSNLNWQGFGFYPEENFKSKDTSSYLGNLLKEEVLSDDKNLGKIIHLADPLQVHDLYLICQTKQGLAIIDQHAAHERILYEKLLESFKKHQNQKQTFQLKKALLLDLSFSDAQILQSNLEVFQELGFLIEQFGDTTFKIESIPLLFKDRDIRPLLIETLDEVKNNQLVKDLDSRSQRMLSYLACRSAIKAGDKLTKKQAKDLLEELEKLDGIYTCPHGRPIKIEIPLKHLHLIFKRS